MGSKKVKGWTIRQIPPPGQELLKLPYPNTETHTAASAAISAVQPCKVEYKVPSQVIVRKNPEISWWDTATETWSTEGITEIAWEPEVRKVSFFSARLASFSITQEKHLDLPYSWWCIRPCAARVCQLTVQAARYQLVFVISEDGLRLKGPDVPELCDLMWDGTGPDKAPLRGITKTWWIRSMCSNTTRRCQGTNSAQETIAPWCASVKTSCLSTTTLSIQTVTLITRL